MNSRWIRGLLAGLVGGLAWLVGIIVIFVPAQALLADPERQSAKFLAAFTAEPLPRTAVAPWLLPLGLLAIAALWGLVYVRLYASWSGAWWKRGCQFGVVSWVLMAPWFEFYLPWNVLWEPTGLVLVELMCWAAVLQGVGLTIAGVEGLLARRSPSKQVTP